MTVTYKTRIPAILNGIPHELDEATRETAEDIGSLAQQLAPVDTGELRDSKEISKLGELRYRVAFTAPYAVYVEYGTDRSPAQPFLTPAVRNIDLTLHARQRLRALFGKGSL